MQTDRERTRSDKEYKYITLTRVHGTRFQVDEDGTGDVLATGRFVVVNIDALELEIGITDVVSYTWVRDKYTWRRPTVGVDSVFVGTRLDVQARGEAWESGERMVIQGGRSMRRYVHDFPEFGTDLVTTLTGLQMNDFSHSWREEGGGATGVWFLERVGFESELLRLKTREHE